MLKEKNTKKAIIITDETNIKPLQEFLSKRQTIKIRTGIAKEIHQHIPFASLLKICSLSSIPKHEEYILLKYISTQPPTPQHYNHHQHFHLNNQLNTNTNIENLCTATNINDPIEPEDSFEINYNQQQKPLIIDTDDLKADHDSNGQPREKHQLTPRDTNEVNSPSYVFISAYHHIILVTWEVLYCILIIIGINIWIHLLMFVINVNTVHSFYVFYAGVLGGILIWTGSACLWCFVKDEYEMIYKENTTMGMMTAFVMTIGAWVIIPTLNGSQKGYVVERSWYGYLYGVAVICEMGVMLSNFTMEAYYREYGSNKNRDEGIGERLLN